MYYYENCYDNKHYVKATKISRQEILDGGLDEVVFEAEFQFLHGSQVRINRSREDVDRVICKVPSSNFDWLKHLIVNITPSLNFGWLVPRYKDILAPQTIINESYINVMPVPEQYKDRSFVCFRSLDPYTFLESEPSSKKEIELARSNLLKGQEMAYYFV